MRASVGGTPMVSTVSASSRLSRRLVPHRAPSGNPGYGSCPAPGIPTKFRRSPGGGSRTPIGPSSQDPRQSQVGTCCCVASHSVFEEQIVRDLGSAFPRGPGCCHTRCVTGRILWRCTGRRADGLRVCSGGARFTGSASVPTSSTLPVFPHCLGGSTVRPCDAGGRRQVGTGPGGGGADAGYVGCGLLFVVADGLGNTRPGPGNAHRSAAAPASTCPSATPRSGCAGRG